MFHLDIGNLKTLINISVPETYKFHLQCTITCERYFIVLIILTGSVLIYISFVSQICKYMYLLKESMYICCLCSVEVISQILLWNRQSQFPSKDLTYFIFLNILTRFISLSRRNDHWLYPLYLICKYFQSITAFG